MGAAEISRYAALGVGGFQVLANGLLLVRGFTRLPQELTKEGVSVRIEDLLRTAWVHGMLGNLCLGVVLLLVASGLPTKEPLARGISTLCGLYYVVLGVTIHWFGQGRHPGLLAFTGLGAVLLLTLWLSR